MSYHYRPRYGFGGMLTPMVKYLLIINLVVFFLEYITGANAMIYVFGLVPWSILHRLALWQFFTYMFLHGGFGHLFFNMFALWMFGSEIERYWGSREFLKYYFLTGVGAGILTWLTAINSPIPTIGASGAIFGILVAYGMLFPNRPVYLYFMIPIKAKHLVILFAVIELWSSWGYTSGGIAHFAHLGGMLFGYLYLKRERFSYLLGGLLREAKSKKEAQKRRRDEQERELERKVDEILQKISREGKDSLTREEKELLEWASKRYH
jgi:membrane associated rhomboid family serine protease